MAYKGNYDRSRARARQFPSAAGCYRSLISRDSRKMYIQRRDKQINWRRGGSREVVIFATETPSRVSRTVFSTCRRTEYQFSRRLGAKMLLFAATPPLASSFLFFCMSRSQRSKIRLETKIKVTSIPCMCVCVYVCACRGGGIARLTNFARSDHFRKRGKNVRRATRTTRRDTRA